MGITTTKPRRSQKVYQVFGLIHSSYWWEGGEIYKSPLTLYLKLFDSLSSIHAPWRQ